MIISDLNYLEVINEAGVYGAGISVDKDVDIDVDVDLDFDTDITLDKDVNVDVSIDSDVDVSGNAANLTFEVTAIGGNTLAEGDVSVVVTDGLSEVSGSLIAAVS